MLGTKGLRVAALVSAASVSSQALAQNADVGWELDCKDDACVSSRALNDEKTGKLAATFFVLVPKEGKPRIGTAVPLGAAMAPGVRFVIGENAITIPFEVCYPDGCRAMKEFDDTETELLATGDTLQIRFFPFGSDRPVAIDMPLEGFADMMSDAREKQTE